MLITSRVTDVRSSQQYAGLGAMPFIFLYIAAEIALKLNARNLALISLVLGIIAYALFQASTRTFHRDEILTRWK